MARPFALTPERQGRSILEALAGHSVTEIAAEVGVHRATIYRELDRDRLFAAFLYSARDLSVPAAMRPEHRAEQVAMVNWAARNWPRVRAALAYAASFDTI